MRRQVATFQLAVLLLFNTADTISLADIQSFVQVGSPIYPSTYIVITYALRPMPYGLCLMAYALWPVVYAL